MIRKASFHCGRHSQRLVDTTEIVIGMVDRNHVAVLASTSSVGWRSECLPSKSREPSVSLLLGLLRLVRLLRYVLLHFRLHFRKRVGLR